MKKIIFLIAILSFTISLNAQSKNLSVSKLNEIVKLIEDTYKELYPGNERVKMSLYSETLNVKVSIYDLSSSSGIPLSKAKQIIKNNPLGMGEKLASIGLFQTIYRKNIGIRKVRIDFVAYDESYYGGTYDLGKF
ncbi:hypothetical protein [uncultured Lutibacter sp.]|uniref:hypothetical protein n=1 Tax=uncultured Lutibacter sp. TaxID=437739 RepID=UPI0026219CFF|nr:hypothetical protein [uncultured Lutibacter sp.]